MGPPESLRTEWGQSTTTEAATKSMVARSRGDKMEILDRISRMSCGRCGPQIVLIMVAIFAVCAPFARAQTTYTTYTYTGNTFTYDPYSTLGIGVGQPFVFEPSSVQATVTFTNLSPGYTGSADASSWTASSLGYTCDLSNLGGATRRLSSSSRVA